MEKSAHGGVTSRLLTGTRILFIGAAVGALLFGYSGLSTWIGMLPHGAYGQGVWNVAYYDLQLFVLGSDPLQEPGPYPLYLELARFAAPAATVYAVFEAGRALFAGEFRRWRNRRRRGHAIVVGDTPVARVLAGQLELQGRRVQTTVDFGRAGLRAVGIARAAAVYACDDDDVDSTLNVAIAQAAATARRRKWRTPKLKVYAHVSSATLALGLRARWLGQATRPAKLDIDFFNVDELAARGSLLDNDFRFVPGTQPHILVAGLGTFGRALLVAYAQRWLLLPDHQQGRVRVTVVGARDDEVAELAAQWDCVGKALQVQAVSGDLEAALRTLAGRLPHRSYICYEDENQALFAALTVARLWRGGTESVMVRLNRLTQHEAFNRDTGNQTANLVNLLDDVDGRLRLLSVTTQACRPEAIAEDLVEHLAQAIHYRYRVDSVGKTPVTPTSQTEWRDLDEGFREANRAAALDIGVKLRLITATVAPRTGQNDPFVFAPAEVEELAEHEHNRWCDQRKADGWRYGPVRIDAEKIHTSLRPWSDLTDEEREKDREAVRNLPLVLAEVGLEIVRLSELDEPPAAIPAQVSVLM